MSDRIKSSVDAHGTSFSCTRSSGARQTTVPRSMLVVRGDNCLSLNKAGTTFTTVSQLTGNWSCLIGGPNSSSSSDNELQCRLLTKMLAVFRSLCAIFDREGSPNRRLLLQLHGKPNHENHHSFVHQFSKETRALSEALFDERCVYTDGLTEEMEVKINVLQHHGERLVANGHKFHNALMLQAIQESHLFEEKKSFFSSSATALNIFFYDFSRRPIIRGIHISKCTLANAILEHQFVAFEPRYGIIMRCLSDCNLTKTAI